MTVCTHDSLAGGSFWSCQICSQKISPIKGWGGLSKMSDKMSKMSIIELSRLGQDLFDFSGLT